VPVADPGRKEVLDVETAERSWYDKARSLSYWFEMVGLVGMAIMGLTTLVDVIGSKVLQRPLPGSTEIVSVLQVATIAFGLAFSKVDGRHIRVDVFVNALPPRGRALLDAFGALLGLALFIALGWMMCEHGINLGDSGTKTLLLGIPLAPFSFAVALCCMPMCLVILSELVASLRRMIEQWTL
jgi:TRAP-type transport system small permease protein